MLHSNSLLQSAQGRSMKIAKQMAAYMALTQGLKLTSPHPRKKQQQIGKTEDAKLPLAIKAEVKSDTSLNKKIPKNEVARMVLDSMPPLEKSEAEDLPELKKTILVPEGSAAVRSGSKKLDANSRLKTIPMPCYPTTLICLLYPQDTNFLSSTHMNSSGQFTCTLTIGSMTFAGSGEYIAVGRSAAFFPEHFLWVPHS
ncbi:unnamed protein product [Notodromas monacha]|uniref:Uncharacterized protein n=1 Tax=Notodromas monacha TaxID=399045 RepID=A0A7R9BP85_9CRUS|nr:unnamed protein product [Notodromas monacha]CAG0918858.1 unnamed protein product [Notodromas monacha]